MQAVHGAFFIEDRSCKGSTWTEEDERRLRGRFLVRNGYADPHVMCPGGPFFIGRIPLPAAGAQCRFCAKQRVRDRRCDGLPFCFACGRLQ